jgi:hypothetical protein
MNRKELEYTLNRNHYIQGGTKEACVKCRDFLHYVENTADQLGPLKLYTRVDKFVAAVKTLMAYAFRQKDTFVVRRDIIVYEEEKYLPDGTKKACVTIRDFFHDVKDISKQLRNKGSCITIDEFIEAVKTLVDFVFKQEDAIPETWACDSDCRMTSYILCPGECNINKESEKTCPFFQDEANI